MLRNNKACGAMLKPVGIIDPYICPESSGPIKHTTPEKEYFILYQALQSAIVSTIQSQLLDFFTTLSVILQCVCIPGISWSASSVLHAWAANNSIPKKYCV